jgi:4-amino-4-deoxy-L-arabinose transferase-like glycosyltransferase
MPRKSGLAIALGVRLVLILAVFLVRGGDGFRAIDTYTYLTPAANILEDFRYTGPDGEPELFRTPGYPLLLVPGVAAGSPIAYALALNLGASLALVALLFGLARQLVGERAAGWCALVAALEPTMLLWSVKVMPETLLTLALLCFVFAALRGRIVLAAVALCAAAYLKPVAWPFVPIAFAYLFFREGWRRSLVFLVTCVALLAPWHLRNHAVTGFPGFSTVTERTLYFGVGASIAARQEGTAYGNVRARMLKDAAAIAPRERYPAIRREGLRLLRTDPAGYARTHLASMARTLFEPGAIEYLRLFGAYPEEGGSLLLIVDRGLVRGSLELARTRPVAVWSSVVLAVLLLPLVVLPFGSWRSASARGPAVLFALLALWLVAAAGVVGASRFRVPAVPCLVLLGALALHSTHDTRSGRDSARNGGGDRHRVCDVAADGASVADE